MHPTLDLTAARARMIVGLDLDSTAEAEAMTARIGDAASVYKIGFELVAAGGLGLVPALLAAGKRIFLDMKLHDIPNTVESATRRFATLGVSYLTVHAYPQTMAAAVRGRGDAPLTLLGVSVLTSMEDADLAAAGYGLGVTDLVRRRAKQAAELGMDGLVCAPTDVAAVRETVGHSLRLVTPGIRPAGGAGANAVGDQKRVMTPGEAIRSGADAIVVGRPVTRAADPRAAAEEIARDILANMTA